MLSFGQLPGVWSLYADVSEHCPFHLHRQVDVPMKMEQTECSETSAYKLQTLGNYPKESIQHTEHGESLKSRICCFLVSLQVPDIFMYEVCKHIVSTSFYLWTIS